MLSIHLLFLISQTMERFYEKINDPNYNAATFFAVCRGKVEEQFLYPVHISSFLYLLLN